eukprot:Amastigsp_a677609_14.p3 type:complete len:236 gc:universal Amastigsp_a677609_14:490-1197(+)
MPKSVSKRLKSSHDDLKQGLLVACRGGKVPQVRIAHRRAWQESSVRDIADVRDQFLLTPLHVACAASHAAVVKLLVTEFNHPINVLDKFGRSPMLLAAYRADTESLETLFETGASPCIPRVLEECGRWALGPQQSEIVRCTKLLARRLVCKPWSHAFFAAMPSATRERVRFLLCLARDGRQAQTPRSEVVTMLGRLSPEIVLYLVWWTCLADLTALCADQREPALESNSDAVFFH